MTSTTPNPRVLVTGATGAVGPAVVAALIHAGFDVRTLTRKPPRAGLFASTVETCLGDVTDAGAVQAAVTGVEVVVHLAALLHIANPAPALRAAYTQINVDGTRVVVDAARLAGVQRLVFGSTIAVYGPYPDQVVTEQTVPQPDTLYGETKLAAEELVLQAKREDDMTLGTVLRLAAVYGTRVRGNYLRLVQSLAQGRFVPIGDGRNRRTLVYDQDVAQAVVLAAIQLQAAGQIYNVADGQVHALREIIVAICAGLDRRPPRFSLPVRPVRWAARSLEVGGALVGKASPITPATIDKYTEEIRVSSARIQQHLGFSPVYDLQIGWRETIRGLRAAGEL